VVELRGIFMVAAEKRKIEGNIIKPSSVGEGGFKLKRVNTKLGVRFGEF
jgi:hypothetical protein